LPDGKPKRRRNPFRVVPLCAFEIPRWWVILGYQFFTGISVALLYRVVWKCIDAINECDDLAVKFPTTLDKVKDAARGFETISTQGCIWNCVSVIDGYHLQIQTPSKNEVRMCNPSSLVITRRMV
jgi:hypothetical protein